VTLLVPIKLNNNEIVFDVEYDFTIHVDKKFPKLKSIKIESQSDGHQKLLYPNFYKIDLIDLLDHNLKEQINNQIFKEINRDLYPE